MRVIVLLFLFNLITDLFGCDICSGGMNTNSMNGVLPQFNKNLIGVRTTYQGFKHPQTPLNVLGEKQVVKDVYWSEDIWLRYYLKPKIQAIVTLPFRQNIRMLSEGVQKVNGVGDLMFQINYSIYNSDDTIIPKTMLMWWVGVGIKLPTGKYQQRDYNKSMLPPGLQVGTGAYSYLINNQISIRKDNIGVNWHSSLSLNAYNELQYKIGNVYQLNLQINYRIKTGEKVKYLPQLGIHYMYLERDKYYGLRNINSGGERVLLSLGLDLFVENWLFSAIIYNPILERKGLFLPQTLVSSQFNLAYFF